MKKIMNSMLMAAVVCGLSIAVISCHDKNDDSNNGPSEEEQAQQALEEQERDNIAFAVLAYLANVSNAPADFLSGTYEPTIGRADDGDANTRIVNTNTMEMAAERFADLAEAEIDENTETYTWADERMGTMTYTKSTDGKSWATVDVSIKQIPHLQKIIYRSPEQADNNGKFKGTAYYRFGDVVLKKNADGNNEYWICVRPAFGPEGKEDSHWITTSPLPSKNVWTYKGSNGIDYALPTGLGDNKEHAQNFAEMLFAICFPEEWENNIINNPRTGITNSGIPMFHDFDKANLKYHRKYFWQRVQDAWTNRPLFYEIFGPTGGLNDFKAMLKSEEGLNLLTHGYSWITKGFFATNSPTLYRYCFKNGENKKSNMHLLEGNDYKSVKAEVIRSKIKLNVNEDYNAMHPSWIVSDFFGKVNDHYIIRFATGAQLSSNGYENPKEPLQGVNEVYRYNAYYGITDLNIAPEVLDRSTGKVVNESYHQKWTTYRGVSHYRFGDIYKDENGHKWMVLLMSGSHMKNGKTFDGDSACFTELVSIDGLTPSADKRKITNLPTRDQAIRAATMLYYFNTFSQNLKLKMENEELRNDEAKYSRLGKTILNQVETCNFDVRMLYQIVRAQQESHWSREPSFMGSVAYNDPTDTDSRQRLLRFICNLQNDQNQPRFYLWEHYVDNPDSKTELYADTLYNGVPIYLQDIASLEMINLCGEDSYARMPLFSWDAWSGGVSGDYRLPRGENDVDKKANDINNYYYDMAKWKSRDFPRDMWNAPVIMFRMTAVYDRGDAEYATVTVDGHNLTPLKVRDWIDSIGDDYFESGLPYSIWISVMNNAYDNIWLDGKRIDWPAPFKTWKQEYK